MYVLLGGALLLRQRDICREIKLMRCFGQHAPRDVLLLCATPDYKLELRNARFEAGEFFSGVFCFAAGSKMFGAVSLR